MIKNSPFNAENVGSIPGQGTKIPHAMGQLSPHIATREACVLQRRPSAAKKNFLIFFSIFKIILQYSSDSPQIYKELKQTHIHHST